MAKTPMTQARRAGILEWMYKQYDEKHLPALQKAAEKAIAAANKALRAKYPESDMVILRKYHCARQDVCLKFMDNETTQVFGIDFAIRRSSSVFPLPNLDLKSIADIPSGRGCNSNEVFAISPTGRNAIEAFGKTLNEFAETRKNKFSDYGALTLGCKTVDELNEVIPLPEDIKQRYMSGAHLIALSEDKIAELKKEFSPKKKAA